MTAVPELLVYTVPNCADCEAIKRLLTQHGLTFRERNLRTDPTALPELQRRTDVRIAPVTIIDGLVLFGPIEEQRPQLLAALARRTATL
jgi:glutaredoxin